jgi:hypothetical protein
MHSGARSHASCESGHGCTDATAGEGDADSAHPSADASKTAAESVEKATKTSGWRIRLFSPLKWPRQDPTLPPVVPRETLDEALARASEEAGLQTYYRDCVRPLLRMPRTQWPTCCGGGCEPCNQKLVVVADRVLTLVGVIDPPLPL